MNLGVPLKEKPPVEMVYRGHSCLRVLVRCFVVFAQPAWAEDHLLPVLSDLVAGGPGGGEAALQRHQGRCRRYNVPAWGGGWGGGRNFRVGGGGFYSLALPKWISVLPNKGCQLERRKGPQPKGVQWFLTLVSHRLLRTWLFHQTCKRSLNDLLLRKSNPAEVKVDATIP